MREIIAYEFASVTDKEGNDKMNVGWHANPVYIDVLLAGRSAHLSYVDRTDGWGLTTSTVEEIFIHANSVKITTLNTIYWLRPTLLRRG